MINVQKWWWLQVIITFSIIKKENPQIQHNVHQDNKTEHFHNTFYKDCHQVLKQKPEELPRVNLGLFRKMQIN